MMPKTLVLAADFHLDAPFTTAGSTEFARVRREDLRNALAATVDLALEQGAQALLISGDLYEHSWATPQTLSWVARQFSRLAPVPVVLIPGNHDPLVAQSWHLRADWPANVTHLTRENPFLDLPDEKIRIAGYGFEGEFGAAFDPAVLPEPRAGFLNVLMLHGTLDMAFTGDRYCPVSTEQLAAAGFDLVALGHFHGCFTRSLRLNDGREALLVNPGSPEPLGFDEPGEHGIVVVRVTGDESGASKAGMPEAVFHPIATRRMHRLTVDLTEADSDEAVVMAACAVLEGLSPERDLADIHLAGRCVIRPDLRALDRRFADHRRYLRFTDDTQPVFNREAIRRDPGLRGLFLREMERQSDLARLSGDAELQVRVDQAIRLGLEALETGNVPECAGGGMV